MDWFYRLCYKLSEFFSLTSFDRHAINAPILRSEEALIAQMKEYAHEEIERRRKADNGD